MHIHIINGPNLNLLGTREPEVYGGRNFEEYIEQLRAQYPDIQIDYFQSNVEGLIIDELQKVGFTSQGIILNAGGYTHTSVAIRDAISAISSPVVEVHISNIYAREEFRKTSLISEKVVGSIAGLGLDGYRLALEFLISK
jgi:3-dehydroquinate dehydratase-2